MRTEKQKILILGANGQVGKELSRRAGNFEVNATAFTRTELDITDSQAVARILENLRPNTVINLCITCLGMVPVPIQEEDNEYTGGPQIVINLQVKAK